MNRSELVAAVAEHTGHSQAAVNGVVDAIFAVVSKEVASGNKVTIPGVLGSSFCSLKEGLVLFAGIKHGGSILCSDISALSIELTRIMHGEKRIQDHIRRNYIRIKSHRYRLGVTSRTGANLLIRWVLEASPGVTRNDIAYSAQNAVGGIQAPETATGNYISFHNLDDTRHR